MATILMVEDDGFIREITEVLVQSWGYRTLSAGDTDEALVFLRSSQQIDALFTDIYLKEEVDGGFNLAFQALQLRPKMRVLYATGNTLTHKMMDMFVDGAECLRKPYTPDQLQRSLETMLPASH